MNISLLPGEIIVDSFAGGGGASLAIEMALGRGPDIAINHDPEAIAVHTANHPHTRHFCESVWDVNPLEATCGRPVGLAWFSPDCKHFSKAKGGKPVSKKIRGLAWVVIRWAAKVKPRIIILENVEEFQTWGPLKGRKKNRPCPARKGQYFHLFVSHLQALGYQVEWKELKACDFGAPTSRKRLFIVARRDGLPIVWPKPSHGPGRAQPYRTAADCIDWSLPCPSIFGRKKPLAENTLRRIARGLKKYVLESADPFIVRIGHTGHGDSGKVRGINSPLGTVTTKAEHCLISPTLVQTGYGERHGQAPRSLDIEQPLGTVVAGGAKHALVSAFLAKHYGGVTGQELEKPLGTVTTVDHHSLVTAHIQRDFGKSVGTGAGAPLGAITAGGMGKNALVTSHLVKLRGSTATHQQTAQDLRDPSPTITAGGLHLAEVRAFLIKYYGTDGDPVLGEPLHTITTKHRFGLVTVAGQDYQIADIGLRMLSPKELFLCQGFPEAYQFEISLKGKRLSKAAQVRMCGNSVSPPAGAALILANVGVQEPMGPALHEWVPGLVKSGEQLSWLDLDGIA